VFATIKHTALQERCRYLHNSTIVISGQCRFESPRTSWHRDRRFALSAHESCQAERMKLATFGEQVSQTNINLLRNFILRGQLFLFSNCRVVRNESLTRELRKAASGKIDYENHTKLRFRKPQHESLDVSLDWWQDSRRRHELRANLRRVDEIDPDDVIMSPDRAKADGLTPTVCFPVGNITPEGSVVKSTAIDPTVVDAKGVYRKRGGFDPCGTPCSNELCPADRDVAKKAF
jgi:hypothetical protein